MKKRYHHGDLKRALILEAMELIEEDGALSLRELGRRLGVSPGAPYRHFKSRAALMDAVAEEARRLHQELVLEISAGLKPGLSLFRAQALASARMATTRPRLFEQMSLYKIDPEQARVGQAHLEELLAQAQESGVLTPGPVEHKLLAALALSHGLTRLKIDGQLDLWGITTDLEQLMMEVTDVLGQGLLLERDE